MNEEERFLWVKSRLPDVQLVTGLTVPQLCRQNMQGWSHLVAFECAETLRQYTREQVYQLSLRFAVSLIKTGLKAQDVVSVVLPNCIEYVIIVYGIWYAGCVPSLMNPVYTEGELKHSMEMVGAKATITTSDLVNGIFSSEGQMKPWLSLRLVVTLDDGPIPNGCLSFAHMISTEIDAKKSVSQVHAIKTDDTCRLLFSSGTTGPPKAVMLTHESLATNMLQCSNALASRLRSPCSEDYTQERFIGVLPFYHLYAFAIVMNLTMFKGCHTLVLPSFHPDTFTAAVCKHKPTFLHVVPPLTSFLTNSSQISADDMKTLHTAISAGSPTGKCLTSQFTEKFGKNKEFMECYGMTELSPVSHLLLPGIFNSKKLGSVGEPIGSTLTKIVDVTTGKALHRYERGEICVKGPQVMKGYYNNEKATAATIDSEGWLHTGDVGYYDDDNCLYIVDRIKELIKVKGFQVSPSELEDLLRTHTKVEDVAVIGIPDEKYGELPRGYIVSKNKNRGDADLKPEEIHEFLSTRVTTHKQLRGGIEFLAAIPKSASGKILRKELLQQYRASNSAGNGV